MSQLLHDLVIGFRGLKRTPGFSLLAALTLALGIGGTITVFAAVHVAFLKPLPYPGEASMVRIYQQSARFNRIAIPWLVARDYREMSGTIASLGVWIGPGDANVATGVDPRRSGVTLVSSEFFAAMGAAPIAGRTFAPDETRAGAPPAVLVGERFWRDALGGGEVIGRRIQIDGTTATIVGVLPSAFAFPVGTEIWSNLDRIPPESYGTRTAHNFSVVARLNAGVTVASAQADLDTVTARLKAAYPDVAKENSQARVVLFREDLLGPQSSMLVMGLGSVLLVLAIACVNVVNLLLARGVSRQHEASVRLALGADGWSLIRPFLAESLCLAIAGGAAGLILASWGVQLVTGLAPASVVPPDGLGIDATVAIGAGLLTIVTGLVCGVLPAMRAAHGDVRAAISGASRTIAPAPRRTMLTLVGTEMALTFALLVGAGLFVRTLANLSTIDSGFRTDGIGTTYVGLNTATPSPHADPSQRARFFADLEARVRALGPIEQVALATFPPLSTFSPNARPQIDGRTEYPPSLQAHYRLVGGDYFSMLGLAATSGRTITSADDASQPTVAVINQSLERLAWPDSSPLGQRIRMANVDNDQAWATIVGVVPDVQHFGPGSPPVAELYFSYRQKPGRTHAMTLLTRSSAPVDATTALVRSAIGEMAPSVAPRFGSLQAQLDVLLEPARFRATLLAVFGGAALVLALVGLVGVVSYASANRRQEMAIRIALGADRRRVTSLVVRQGMKPALIGLAVGLVGTLFLTRFYGDRVQALLFGTEPRDTLTFVAVAIGLVVAAFIANLLPARRAARVNPMEALRQ